MSKSDSERPWTDDEIKYLQDNITKLPIADIARELNRTQNCVNIKLLRLRTPRCKGGLLKEMVSRNMIIEMLEQRIGSPDTFRPTREFLQRTGIGQKRFWQLYRGEKNITEPEYRALAKEWKITLEDAFVMRQLKMDLE